MKTAVSIPKDVYERAKQMAKKRRISRSQLITETVKSYLDEYDETEIIAKINKVCEKVDTSVDPVMSRIAALALPKDEW